MEKQSKPMTGSFWTTTLYTCRHFNIRYFDLLLCFYCT